MLAGMFVGGLIGYHLGCGRDRNMIRPGDEIFPLWDGDFLAIQVLPVGEGGAKRTIKTCISKATPHSTFQDELVDSFSQAIAMSAGGWDAEKNTADCARHPGYTIVDPYDDTL